MLPIINYNIHVRNYYDFKFCFVFEFEIGFAVSGLKIVSIFFVLSDFSDGFHNRSDFLLLVGRYSVILYYYIIIGY